MKRALALISALAIIAAAWFAIPAQEEKPSPTGQLPKVNLAPAPIPQGTDTLPADFHKQFLSASEQEVYDQLEAGLRSLDADIAISPCNEEELGRCYRALLNDNPDVFWLGPRYEYQMTVTGTIVTVSPDYTISDPDEIARVLGRYEQLAQDIVSALPDDDYGKAKGIFSWIADNCSYDDAAARSQSIAGVFDDGRAACAGYARAFAYLCSYASIPCAYIPGMATADDGEGEVAHAWNCAVLDGVTVYLDATWGDRDGAAPTDYSWLGLTLEDISTTHFADADIILPEANEDGYEIWSLMATGFQGFDQEAVYARVLAAIDARDETTCLRFSDAATAEEAKHWISEDREFTRRLLQDRPEAFPDPAGRGLFGLYEETGIDAMVLVWQF